jgi:hypothetical protein
MGPADPAPMRNAAFVLAVPFAVALGAACNCGGMTVIHTSDDGGTSDDAGADAGGGASDGGDGGCGSVVLQASLVPGNVVVVFDQSDSMNQGFGDAGPKYQVASAALLAAITPIQGELNLGAVFQPTGPEQNKICPPVAPMSQSPPQIPLQDGGSFIAAWNAHFLPPWKLLLGTPLGDALDQANAALLASPPAGKTAVVVMTDGQPNCGETLPSILAPVQAMASRGIPTYVVGLPGASGATVLMDLADAGGTGNYLLPADAAELRSALAQIATGALDQCVIQLNPPPPDPGQVHLVVTLSGSGSVYQVAPDAGGGGWILSANSETATLLGNTCATAEDGGYAKIEFDYGCVTLPFQ